MDAHRRLSASCMAGGAVDVLDRHECSHECIQVTGVMEDIEYTKGLEDMEGVLYARALVPAGGACVCVDDGLPTWVAELMVERSPVEAAVDYIKELEQIMFSKMKITPKPIASLN